MRDKRINLAAGRLDLSALNRPESAAGSRRSNYGVKRLGIAVEEEAQPPRQEERQDSPPAEEYAPPPAEEAAAGTTEEPPSDAASTGASEQTGWSEQAPQAIPSRGRSRLLIAGTVGAAAAVLMVLVGWWLLGSRSTTPQTAVAAGPGQAPTHDAARPGSVQVSGPSRPPLAMPAPPGAGGGESTAAVASERPQPAETSTPPSQAATVFSPALAQTAAALWKMSVSQGLWGRAGQPGARPGEPDRTGSAAPDNPPPAPPPRPSPPPPKPALTHKTSVPGIQVSGIMRGPDGNMAIINNRFVRCGATVGQAKIITINQMSVEIELDGQRILLGVSTSGGGADADGPPVQTRPPPATQPANS
jgi:hypothetical protein